MQHAAQQIGFQEYLHSVTESSARIARLEQAMRDALPDWRLKPLVQALQGLLGHSDVSTTMIYTHCTTVAGGGVASPLDALTGLTD